MSKTLQQQLAGKLLKQFPKATVKKIDKDNYLDIHIPVISEKIGTHFTFTTTRNGIKLSVYSKDDVLCEQFLENSSELELANRGVRLKDNPIYDTVKKAIEGALFLIGELIESKKAPAIKKAVPKQAVPATKKLVLKKAVPKKAVPKSKSPKNDSVQNVPEEKQLKKLAKSVEIKFLKIGKQEWMTENLNVDTFRNGDLIPEAKSDKAWKEAGEKGQPAWCYYDNKSINGKKYGKLYNWYAVNDPRGLAPDGWLIPDENDLLNMTSFLFEKDIQGKVGLKISDCLGGQRYKDGSFRNIGEWGNWWSNFEGITGTDNAWYRYLTFNGPSESRQYHNKSSGFSIRCLKNSKK